MKNIKALKNSILSGVSRFFIIFHIVICFISVAVSVSASVVNLDAAGGESWENPIEVSPPVTVTWSAISVGSLQLYENGQLREICNGTCFSGIAITCLKNEQIYEIKAWCGDAAPCKIKWIKFLDPTGTTCPPTTTTSVTSTSTTTTTSTSTTSIAPTTSTTSTSTSTTTTTTTSTSTTKTTTSTTSTSTSSSTSTTRATTTSTTSTTLPMPAGTIVLAAYQAWHGLPNHTPHPLYPYRSDDPEVISEHIKKAMAQNIGGFAVDWYGKPNPAMANNNDRIFIDKVTAMLIEQAEKNADFKVALMYDEGTLKEVSANFTEQVIADLNYAKEQGYFDSPAYFKYNGKPVIFVFPYDDVDPKISWSDVKNALNIPVILLDKDPNPENLDHDKDFDGFYPWIQAEWKADGSEWGEGYLKWFYSTMANDSSYSGKIKVGAIWPGFNDALASWGSNRYISRRCGETWNDTWKLAQANNPPIVLIETWNDFEEGTDIEFLIYCCSEIDMDSMDKCNSELSPSKVVSPVKITWNSYKEMEVQIYHAGKVIYGDTGGDHQNKELHFPGFCLSILEVGKKYEVKIWEIDTSSYKSKWVEVLSSKACNLPKGDVTGDGSVDLKDAVMIMNLLTLDVCGINLGADVNGDGKINLCEVIYILKKIAGL